MSGGVLVFREISQRKQALPLTTEQFWQLPRHPAYKYEYFDGAVHLSPRPVIITRCSI